MDAVAGGCYEKALEHLNRAESIGSLPVDMMVMKAHALLKSGRNKEAIQIYVESERKLETSRNPNSENAKYLRTIIYLGANSASEKQGGDPIYKYWEFDKFNIDDVSKRLKLIFPLPNNFVQ